MEAIIDTHINRAMMFHGVLHVFRAKRGTGTAIMELKIAQELASVYQDLILLVFLGLRKAYDNLDHGRLLKTLEGYGAGPKMRGILAEFWARQEVVTRKNGYHVPQFRATHGTTQGGLTFLTLYNVTVDNVVRYCLYMTLE